MQKSLTIIKNSVSLDEVSLLILNETITFSAQTE